MAQKLQNCGTPSQWNDSVCNGSIADLLHGHRQRVLHNLSVVVLRLVPSELAASFHAAAYTDRCGDNIMPLPEQMECQWQHRTDRRSTPLAPFHSFIPQLIRLVGVCAVCGPPAQHPDAPCTYLCEPQWPCTIVYNYTLARGTRPLLCNNKRGVGSMIMSNRNKISMIMSKVHDHV